MSALMQKYKDQIVGALKEEFSYTTVMQVPRLEKIVLNVGMGDASANPKGLEVAIEELATITGQRPVKTIARKSIAGFKLREGMPMGARVTLRGQRMFEFLERLVNVALPRVRDFKGLNPNGFDGRGNYNMGIKEQIVFPEIDVDKVDSYHGMNITMVSTANTDDEARSLFTKLGLPFRKTKGKE
ncbi:MAG: 50S ribosomal protein L5 [bacterium]|nr:50S ribosomal protein L5 [bacterium]